MYPYILTKQILTIVIDSKQYSIVSTHQNFKKIVKKIKADKTKGILALISIKDKIKGDTFGNIIISDNDKLYYKNVEIHNTLTDKIVQMYRQDFPILAMVNFLENLMENPSQDSIDELYDFLEHGQLPLTDDGCFLAYKKVNSDFTDCYTGQIDNSVGATVFMDRSKVNANRNETCSTGLHFCSFDYLGVYDDKLPTIILKINPRDVVSIPVDYNNAKGRCCYYTVEAQYHDVHKSQFDAPVAKDDVIKMTTKQKMVYALIQKHFKTHWGFEVKEVDLKVLRSNYKSDYDAIIDDIMDLFPKPIARDSAVAHYKFMKENFGMQ